MAEAKQFTATTKRLWLPNLGFFAHFQDRHTMKIGHPTTRFQLSGAYPPVNLPVDWTENNSLSFPLDGNDHYGDCLYAAACHGDNTFTGNHGAESIFNLNTIIQDYLQLSGGDNGLNEGQIVGAWQNGLANTSDARILAALNLDPTDHAAMQAAIYFFGGVLFMLDVPETWYQSFTTGATWDAPATADKNNGHGVWWNGVNTQGYYKLQTWGTYGWITPAGVAVCDPSCFVVFSLRWFNAGVAPNGMTYDQLAALWVQFGGQPFPMGSAYQTRILETATTFVNESDGAWLLDHSSNLVFIKTNNTPNRHVEVHIASRASNYQTRILETATTFVNESDGVWLLDQSSNLVFIKTNNTPNGHVEVHIASRASNYQTRILETATTFVNESDGVWLLDNNSDLVFIKTNNTPNGHVEVHIASRASNYQTRILETATTFVNENDGVWLLDQSSNLVFIKTNNTPTGHVEVHIASRASNYQTRILETATTFVNESDGVWLLDNNSDLVFIKTNNTPNGHVEVHIARR